jgi:hypothetical protein
MFLYYNSNVKSFYSVECVGLIQFQANPNTWSGPKWGKFDEVFLNLFGRKNM